MENKSIWIDTVIRDEYPVLDKDIETNILIIGGGIAGILCAYELKNRGIQCTLVEKDEIGNGTSKDTTAYISAQHETLYQDLIKQKGIKQAKQYLDLNLKAIEKYKELAKKYEFDFKECKSYLYSSESKDIILKEKEALSSLGYEATLIDTLPLDINIQLGIAFENQGSINPLKLINSLAKEINIYEKTMIIKIHKNKAYTKNGHVIKFNKIVIASHYPIINKMGLYFAKLTQRRSYLIAANNYSIGDVYTSIDEDGLYFRSYENKLIIGGYDRDTKSKCSKEIYKNIAKNLKDANIENMWSGQDCITLDGIPYIGKYDSFHKNYYVITGFNFWGFTWAMVASIVIADLIENKKKYSFLSPQRNFLNKNLFINLLTATKNLITLKKPRCKHLGCALHYNHLEGVFECPCHGSRYNKNGKVLDGPSLKNLY